MGSSGDCSGADGRSHGGADDHLRPPAGAFPIPDDRTCTWCDGHLEAPFITVWRTDPDQHPLVICHACCAEPVADRDLAIEQIVVAAIAKLQTRGVLGQTLELVDLADLLARQRHERMEQMEAQIVELDRESRASS